MSFNIGPAAGLPFVGWAHLSVRDSDGHSRQVKGSSAQTPLLATMSGPDHVVIEAELMVNNPLSFIKITNEDSYFFTASFILGSCHHGHRALDHILLQTIPIACNQLCKEDQTEVQLECLVPFVKGGKCQLTLSLVEYKLVTKVAKLKVTLPVAMLSEAYLYRDGLRKYRKLENADDEEKTKTGGTPAEP